MAERNRPGELVPVEDRILWMLGARVAFSVLVLGVWLVLGSTANRPAGAAITWVLGALGWPALTSLTLLFARHNRTTARAALTFSLLGDAVLLGFGWWATGALGSPLSYVVILHGIGVTMLASFRTGVKLAVWHSVITLLLLEAAESGKYFDTPAVKINWLQLWFYVGALWTAVLGIASFAAHNERELRRRRYDSEALQIFGGQIVAQPEPAVVAGALAAFAHGELNAVRTAVVALVREGAEENKFRTLAVVVEDDLLPRAQYPGEITGIASVVDAAMALGRPILRSRLDPVKDAWLSAAMPDARGLVVVPFLLEQARGALIVQMGTAAKRINRVERRVVNTAEQATSHAAGALQMAVLNHRLRAQSETDGLTQVSNRRRFDDFLASEISRSAETGLDMALLLVDIDHFKRLNDTYGHQVGDEVLRDVAQAIRLQCPEPHLVARYGGEEFAVVLVDTDPVASLAAAERVRLAIAASGGNISVTASLGVAAYPGHGLTPAEVISAADAALYRAKERGRNQVHAAEAAAPVRFGPKFGQLADKGLFPRQEKSSDPSGTTR